MVAADAAGGDHDGLRIELERACDNARARLAAQRGRRREDCAADALDAPRASGDLVDPVAEAEGEATRLFGLAGAADKRLEEAGPSAPGDVEARHRVAVAGGVPAAALGPADDREDAVAHGAQPGALLARGERYIGLGPSPWPIILAAIEACRAKPV